MLYSLRHNVTCVITTAWWGFKCKTCDKITAPWSGYRIYVLFIQTGGWKRVNLFVCDRHHRVVELIQKLRDGLVGQEHSHRGQQQVDEDEHHREDILQAGFADSHRWTACPDVILWMKGEGKHAGRSVSLSKLILLLVRLIWHLNQHVIIMYRQYGYVMFSNWTVIGH